jgi:hypothetical protein
MSYTAPLKDMLFDIKHLANIEQIAKIPGLPRDPCAGAQRSVIPDQVRDDRFTRP